MKSGMSSFDIAAMVKEMQCIIGGRIDKAYQLARDKILLRLRVPEEGRKDLVIVVGKWFYLISKPQETPKTPTSFAMLLRKHLSNGTITKIEQHGFDRIVVFHIQKQEQYQLICEMFREGNVVLVQEGKIIQPLIPKSWSKREVRAHREYAFPPSRHDVQNLKIKDYKEILDSSKKDLVRTLAIDFNLGGLYAEEVCLLSKIEKLRKVNDLSEEEGKKVFESIVHLFKSLEKAQGGLIIYEESEMIDIAPFPLKSHEKNKTEIFDNLSSAIEKFQEAIKEAEPEDLEYQDFKAKYERQLAQQKKAVSRLENQVEEYKRKAELIYMRFKECEGILGALKTGIKKKSIEELKKELENIAPIKNMDPAKNMVTIQLSDESQTQIEIKLDYKKSVNENAGAYYDKSKKAKEKLKGAKNSLKETKDLLERIEVEKTKKKEKKTTKQFWFEKYRWFISTDGNIVIAGRDAKTNDKIVKKYLTDRDRYAHADIHGAPSVVVKNKDGDVLDKTLTEACEFALNFSKAWNAKIGSGTAYWVLPDQVSKTPPSGEFLPKGAFMIRGKKNSITDIELRLGVGKIEYKGVEKVMCAPVSAIESLSQSYVIFEPGDMKKSSFTRKICEILNVEHEEVQRILPPGDVKIVKTVGISEGKK